MADFNLMCIISKSMVRIAISLYFFFFIILNESTNLGLLDRIVKVVLAVRF